MVASRQADVASVDSNVLGYAVANNPVLLKDIHVFTSLGPLPAYPIMVRSTLAPEQKQAIVDALLQLEQAAPWNKHITNITTNANKSLGFIRRNIQTKNENREVAY